MLVINHGKINGLVMYVRRQWIIEEFIGKKIPMYGKYLTLEDNDDLISYRAYRVELTEEDSFAFIQELLCSDTIEEYLHRIKLREHGLKEGDILELEDGFRGIVKLDDLYHKNVPVRITIIKKNGEEGKTRRIIYYGHTKYRIIGNINDYTY